MALFKFKFGLDTNNFIVDLFHYFSYSYQRTDSSDIFHFQGRVGSTDKGMNYLGVGS